jgi:hypothetical protein
MYRNVVTGFWDRMWAFWGTVGAGRAGPHFTTASPGTVLTYSRHSIIAELINAMRPYIRLEAMVFGQGLEVTILR